jgi:hypothetical protein
MGGKMAMFNDIVIFPGGKMARGKNYYRTPAFFYKINSFESCSLKQ